MKFSTREDIAAPAEHVFAYISDFGVFERQALRRGADVRRIDNGPYKPGSGWDIAFKYRGRDRRMRTMLDKIDAPHAIQLSSVANGIDGATEIELVSLSPTRTRMSVSIDLTAKSLAARLLLQSLKLAKSSLTARFKKRVGAFAQDVEDTYKG
jgi:hypothetical protein